ncbi:carboxypeptidase-like regulatory domain-containing protein [candidate division KSB1 bacterium]|nr:carboxypeptidase-like regulatory domain-containing protein [candidate division KSB1 bacterium]
MLTPRKEPSLTGRSMARSKHQLLPVVLLFLFYSHLCAQTNRQDVLGTVIDLKTAEPLQGVNVFLANTMMGDATDAEGNFTIKNVPTGQFEIVVSMIGYEVYSQHIRVTMPMEKLFLFRLKTKVLQGETIVVNASEQKEWRKRLELFKSYLLGTTENAKKTIIENELCLDLTINDQGALVAQAAEPLVIINKGLGYKIEYVLRYFLARGKHIKYAGNPKYTSLVPTSTEEKMEWQKKRKKAYEGSIRHFFSELIQAAERIQNLSEKQQEDYYGTYRINRQENSEAQQELQLCLSRDLLKESGYSISYPGERSRLAIDKTFKNKPVNIAQIIAPSETPNECWLKLEDKLYVRYDREKEDPDYLTDFELQKRWVGAQRSTIEVGDDSVRVEKKGRYWDNFQLHTYGYMAWERLAESLPYEYEPEEQD